MPDKRLGVFMVFAENLPDAKRLSDPSTSPVEKTRIRRQFNHFVDVVRSEAARGDSIQDARWQKQNELRVKVMADLRRDARGKPLRGEPKRLANSHQVSLRTVRGWIEDARAAPKIAVEAIEPTWNAVAEGQLLSRERRQAARQRRKPKG